MYFDNKEFFCGIYSERLNNITLDLKSKMEEYYILVKVCAGEWDDLKQEDIVMGCAHLDFTFRHAGILKRETWFLLFAPT